MKVLELGEKLREKLVRTDIVSEGEIAFRFVDGKFDRVLAPGKHRSFRPDGTRVERVLLASPRAAFQGLEAIVEREDVRAVTSSVHVDEGKLGLAFHRGVFLEFLPPGLHVFVRSPGTDSGVTFELVEPTAAGLFTHRSEDAVLRHADVKRHFRVVQIEAGTTGIFSVDGVFVRRLSPGRHVLFETGHALKVDVARPFEPVVTQDVEALASHPELEGKLTRVRVLDTQRGLVFAGDNFKRFLGPGEYLFTEARPPVRVEVVSMDPPEVTHPAVRTLLKAAEAPAHLASFVVGEGQLGLAFVDGAFHARLKPGTHAYWTGARRVEVTTVDLREVGIEIQGQELLTADKVSLRLNMSVRYKLEDVDRAVLAHASWQEALHRALQLSLREVCQRATLDELLSRKEDLGTELLSRAREGADALGVRLVSAGLRDVILPGEMRQILNQVVEAERRAQANVITRREETAATRSLLNTAKLLDENPTLMRLKELEHAERIAEKIGTLSVVGGIDALVPKIRDVLKG